MARWLVNASAHGVVATPNVLALLATLVVLCACVTKLVVLCAAHGSPQVRNRESEPEGELVAESGKKLSQRFSPSAIQAKLSSFRKSSFRNSSSSRNSGSFRIDCTQVDVVDAIQKVQPAQELEDETPGTPAVWQKQILRGERCAPLEFSGLILYDEKGNHVPLHNNRRPLRT